MNVIVYLFLFTLYLLVHVVIQGDFGKGRDIQDMNYGHQKKSVYVISQKSLVKFLNKSTSLKTLSLKGIQLSDMVSPP